MKHRFLGGIASVLLASMLLAACGTPTPPTTGNTDSPTAPAADATSGTDAPTAPAADATSGTDAPTAPATGSGEPFTFGMVLVGPINDGGWNQAHYDAAKYVESKIPGAKFIYIDKVNPADKPNVTVEQVVDELISQGAQFVITNSAEFADGTVTAARANPDLSFMHISGDSVLKNEAPPNMANLMGKMIYGKMIAGCAAALQSETGQLSYLGPLIDSETRRLTNSAFLGARYCWENYRKKPAADLTFTVTWIGFWFNIPGVTLDPTKVATDFINGGSDVILSGIDTTEALVEANKATQAGKKVYAVPYDFKDACTQAPDACLGVPYFNWGPEYVKQIKAIQAGQYKSQWQWLAPDWKNINDPESSIVGFIDGPALSAENKAQLDTFIAGLADGSINLYAGPLKYQDGSEFIKDGETATDEQIWYTEQLLEGMEGQSAAQ